MKSLVYAVADAATAGRGINREINGERIRLPAAHARYFPAVYQPGTAEFIRRQVQPGTTAIDVGAHIGVFTVPMARATGASGRVLAFEPTDSTRGVLLRTVRMNGLLERVEVRPEAVSDREGNASFIVSDGVVGNANRLAQGAEGGAAGAAVRTVTIDRLLPESEHVSLIKVDAEGGELAVLRGAAATIDRCRPALAIDVHAGLPGFGAGELGMLWEMLTSAEQIAPYLEGLPQEKEFLSSTETFELTLTAVS